MLDGPVGKEIIKNIINAQNTFFSCSSINDDIYLANAIHYNCAILSHIEKHIEKHIENIYKFKMYFNDGNGALQCASLQNNFSSFLGRKYQKFNADKVIREADFEPQKLVITLTRNKYLLLPFPPPLF